MRATESLHPDHWRTEAPSHDLHEAIGLGDRLVLLSARPGQIIRIDDVVMPRPRDVFRMHNSRDFRTLYDAIWRRHAAQAPPPWSIDRRLIVHDSVRPHSATQAAHAFPWMMR